MEFRPDGSLLVQTALSMSRLSHEELSREAAEIARLVRLTLGGDSTAFEQIILRYETRVMTLAARLLGARDDARDVAQEVFLRAFKYLHRLDLQKPVEPWLMRITVNVCRDAARTRQRRRDTFVDIETPETIDPSADPYAGVARKQERADPASSPGQPARKRTAGDCPARRRGAVDRRGRVDPAVVRDHGALPGEPGAFAVESRHRSTDGRRADELRIFEGDARAPCRGGPDAGSARKSPRAISRRAATAGSFLEQLRARQSLLKSLRLETVSPSECTGMRREVMSIINDRRDGAGWALRIERAFVLGFRRHSYALAAFALICDRVGLGAGADAAQPARHEGVRAGIRGQGHVAPSGRLSRLDRRPSRADRSGIDHGATAHRMPTTASTSIRRLSRVRENREVPRRHVDGLGVGPRRSKRADAPSQTIVVLLASVKDSSRFDGGWGFFDFTGLEEQLAAKAQALPESSGCRACHRQDAETTTCSRSSTRDPRRPDAGSPLPRMRSRAPPASVRGQSRVLFDAPRRLLRAEGCQMEAARPACSECCADCCRPTSGAILWHGEPISTHRQAYLSSVTYVGHRCAVKDELTTLENLRVSSALSGFELSRDGSARRARIACA